MNLISNRNANESTSSIQHSSAIVQISLDSQGSAATRTLALLDQSHDLYIACVHSTSKSLTKLGKAPERFVDLMRLFRKSGRKIETFKWNATINILAAIQDVQLIVWCCPAAGFNGRLLQLCTLQYDSLELGRNPRICDFVGNSVSVRRGDGSLINVPLPPFPELIHK